MTYAELAQQIEKKNSALCVGLDSDITKIPTHLLKEKYPLFEFNKGIVDATAPYCVAYKPNLAFYEALGVDGWTQLEMTVSYIRANYPEMFLIADAKRGDIGNTASLYAKAFFEKMDFDAVTLSPYMGRDSITPFLKYEGKWVIILAITSNPSAEDFETKTTQSGEPLYIDVLENFSNIVDNSHEKVMFVVGATRPQTLGEIRQRYPKHFFLVPGVGAQGGSAEDVLHFGSNDSCGLLINSSRAIIYASSGEDFAKAAGEAAKNSGCYLRSE